MKVWKTKKHMLIKYQRVIINNFLNIRKIENYFKKR